MTSKEAPVRTFWVLILLMFLVGLSLIGIVVASRVESEEKTEATRTSKEAGKQPPAGHESNHLYKSALGLAEGVGAALVIAALLAGAVDPYAKFRLGKEIGREIAENALGLHLPIELREALEGIQHIGLYQTKMTVDVKLERNPDYPEFLVWSMTICYEVENALWVKQKFKHSVSVNDSHAERADGKISEVSHYINGKLKYKLDGSNPHFVNRCKKESGVRSFTHPDKHKIPSSRQGVTETNAYSQSTERLVSDSEIQVIIVLLPTVGITLTVKHPEGISIYTSLEFVDEIPPEIPECQQKGRAVRWNSKQAYLQNEHIWIMYEIDKKQDAPKEG